MLQTLLSPLRSRFELSPRTPTSSEQPGPLPTHPEDNLNPEEFARDVLIELMRNSVEKLKQADDQRNKSEVCFRCYYGELVNLIQYLPQTLGEIQRIMLQDACTKDVFKEMDGFLCLMSVLSAIQDRPGVEVLEPETQVLQETIECTRWVFLIFSEAMKNHHANTEYFRVGKTGSIFKIFF